MIDDPITSQKRCSCGHGGSRHDEDGKCLVPNCQHCREGFRLIGYDPQAPTIDEVEHAGDKEMTFNHPAFGQITAYRVQGSRTNLYGSDFEHQHYITLEITGSYLQRSLSKDWYHSRERVIAIAMSEAQWATFVSSLNQGGGVPCTIDYERHIGPLPPIKQAYDRQSQFSEEIGKRFNLATGALQEMRDKIEGLSLSQKKKKELLDKLETCERNLQPNMDFVAESFSKHMENTVEAAKIEVNAYAQNLLTSIGQEALQGRTIEPPLLTPGETIDGETVEESED